MANILAFPYFTKYRWSFLLVFGFFRVIFAFNPCLKSCKKGKT